MSGGSNFQYSFCFHSTSKTFLINPEPSVQQERRRVEDQHDVSCVFGLVIWWKLISDGAIRKFLFASSCWPGVRALFCCTTSLASDFCYPRRHLMALLSSPTIPSELPQPSVTNHVVPQFPTLNFPYVGTIVAR